MRETEHKKIALNHGLDPSIILEVKAVNPGFATRDRRFLENCQRCVSAYEARRRGYNVSAKPSLLNRSDVLPHMDQALGWPAVYRSCHLESCRAWTGEHARQKVEALMQSYGDGSRAIVRIKWCLRNQGHVFIAENQDGSIYFLDPQTGNPDVYWYFQYADPGSVSLLRIDQLDFTKLIEDCCEAGVSSI